MYAIQGVQAFWSHVMDVSIFKSNFYSALVQNMFAFFRDKAVFSHRKSM